MATAAALRLVEGSSMDKSKALDAALSQIERNFGKGSIMRLGKNNKAMDVETVSTGSLGLDIALGVGGLPRGRVVEIYGPESSGKTTLALHCLAEAQKKGGICAFIDAIRWLRSSVTTGLMTSMGTVGCSTSTSVEEVYFFGRTSEAASPIAPRATVVRAGIHQ